MADSGLKVNLEKTEVCIFHRMDSSKATIKLGNVSVESQHHIRVLGIIIDNRLLWDQQINKVITDSRKLLQAVKLVRKCFSTEETSILSKSVIFNLTEKLEM